MGPGPYGPPDFRKSPPILKLAMEKMGKMQGRREKGAGEIREETEKKTSRRSAPNWGKYVSALDQESLEKKKRGFCPANLSRITRGSDKQEYCR